MAVDIVMPRLSDSMTEGTIVRWLRGDGDQVAVGDPLLEIETDKATMVYETDTAGVIFGVRGEEGDTFPIGEVLAQVGDPAEAASGAAPTVPSPSVEPAGAPAVAAVAAAASSPALPRGSVSASPLARRIAADKGIDLEALSGSGPGSRIVKRDVLAASAAPAQASQPQPQPPPAATGSVGDPGAKGEVTVEAQSRLQQTVARRMSLSRATVPHFELATATDMSGVLDLRRRLKAAAGEDGVAPSVNDFVLKACAIALREQPRANSAWTDAQVELYSRVNVGMAVAAEGSLVVPTVFDADRKSLGEIARTTRSLAGRVRDGSITPPELAGGTFTVSNLGMFGIDSFDAVINPPQAAILAVGSVAPRVVADGDDEMVVRPTATLTLSCDHRVLYGAEGARLLARIRDLLQEPFGLAL